MPKQRPHTWSDISSGLRGLGCYFIRQNGGSHQIWYSPKARDCEFVVVKPHGTKEAPIGTFKAMLRNSGFTYTEFCEAIDN